MPSPSNIYAEKAYSDHPIGMWALDDQLDYVSYLSTPARNLEENWTVPEDPDASDAVVITESSSNLGQYLGDGLYKIVAKKQVLEDFVGKARITSPVVANFGDMDIDLNNMSMGCYFYSNTEYIKSITIGFTYAEEITEQIVRVSKKFETTVYDNWIYVAETFDIPNETSDINLFLDIEYLDSEDPDTEYTFYVNGLTLGQWSEEFQSGSLGLRYEEDQTGQIIDFPDTIAVDGADKAVIARAYGLQDTHGYYLSSTNKTFAQNSGMPMVFGAESVTKLADNEGLPSLIIPGNGMLNDTGKYTNYTLEAWMRIDSSSIIPQRIVGPVGSTDGIYVDHERFYLKISENVKSAPVPEWGRPMLIHLKYSPGRLALVVNTEELIGIEFDQIATYLPDELSVAGKNQDWLGFYCSQDVLIELDCIGIYPYDVDKTLAKRKWVYGQNVEYPENLNSAYDGKTVAIDYQSSNYAANFVFPKNNPWTSAIYDNVSFTKNSISAPIHPLPEVVLSSGLNSSWLEDQALNNYEGETYFKMRPGPTWDTTYGYLYLENISFMPDQLKTIYGVFKTLEASLSEQVLIKMRDRSSGNYFSIVNSGNHILYKYYDGISETTIADVSIKSFEEDEEDFVSGVGEMFVAGIDIDKTASFYGRELVEFFSNRSNFEIFIAGDNNFENTYLGNIYSFSLSTKRNSKPIAFMFSADGTAKNKEEFQDAVYDAGSTYFGNNSNHWALTLDGGDPYSVISDLFYSYVATYRLSPKTFFGNFVLDISTHSIWEDYVPLSHFAKYVRGSETGNYYDLDFIQFNIAYPSPTKFLEQKTNTDSWSYQQLQVQYGIPTQYTYAELDNELFSGYPSYEDLKNRTKTQYVYDTTPYSAKTYITFQYVSGGANNPIENYTNTENVSTNNLVRAGDEWVNTKYEVVDGTVIYPPRSIKFSDLAIVVHVDMISDGVRTKPVSIPSIELTSQALDSELPTPVGTKFGVPIYPYTKSGLYFNYKKINPFRIYKRSSPYLFLSRNSGIELVGDYEPLENRGLTLPLNPGLASRSDVAAVQVLLRYSGDFFPYSSMPIFEIQSKDAYIKFYLVANQANGKRAKIYAINSLTGLEENGIAFYINGKLVKNPTLSTKQWSMLGISFAAKLSLDSFSGAFRINGPILVNHLSYYQSTGLQEKVFTTFRIWDRVKETINNQQLAWSFWKGSLSALGTFSWNNVLVIGRASTLGISLPEIFKTYVGTNKTIFDDNKKMSLLGYRFRTYKRTTSVSFTKKPS
jgi:hypothetical protein